MGFTMVGFLGGVQPGEVLAGCLDDFSRDVLGCVGVGDNPVDALDAAFIHHLVPVFFFCGGPGLGGLLMSGESLNDFHEARPLASDVTLVRFVGGDNGGKGFL